MWRSSGLSEPIAFELTASVSMTRSPTKSALCSRTSSCSTNQSKHGHFVFSGTSKRKKKQMASWANQRHVISCRKVRVETSQMICACRVVLLLLLLVFFVLFAEAVLRWH